MDNTAPHAAVTQWTVDSTHTTVGFGIRHLMVTTVRGVFQRVSGTVDFDADHPEQAVIAAEIPVATIDTREPQRDAHLRSADFFDAERFPTMTFRSTRVRAVDAGILTVIGDLTIRDVTREIVITVTDVSRAQVDHNGMTRIGASASARIKRSAFGITYNKALEAGGVALSDEVTLGLDVSLVQRSIARAA